MDAGVMFLVALAFLGALTLLLGLKVVAPEEAGTVVTLGKPGKNVKSGLHWVIPFFQSIATIDKRKKRLNPQFQNILSSDLIPLLADFVLTAQSVDARKTLFNVDDALSTSVLLLEAMAVKVLGTVPAYEAISNPVVRERIEVQLEELAQRVEHSFGLNLSDYGLQSLRLPPVLEQAITAQRAADHRKQEMITLAEGEAQATMIERKAQDPYWPEKVKWDAAEKMAKEGKAPIVIMDGGAGSSQQNALLAAAVARLEEIERRLAEGGNR